MNVFLLFLIPNQLPAAASHLLSKVFRNLTLIFKIVVQIIISMSERPLNLRGSNFYRRVSCLY